MDEKHAREKMNAREFFYLVAQMRAAQQNYFATRDRNVFRAARKLENEVDREIARVREIINSTQYDSTL